MLENKKVKIYAGNTANQTVAVFGSLKQNGVMTYSDDPDLIQNENYENGYDASLIAGNAQAKGDQASPLYVMSRELAYLQQVGIKGWLADVSYQIGSIICNIEESKPVLYYSKTANNQGNELSDTTNWQKLQLGGGGNNLFDFKFADHQLNDQSWLRSDTFSWQEGGVYSNAYNHLLADIQGKTATSETINEITINYILADDGHKIILASDTTTLANLEALYTMVRVAWYYILDTENQRFKLPRTQWNVVGLRPNGSVGAYIGAGLPDHNHTRGTMNITGSFAIDKTSYSWNDSIANGAFSKSQSSVAGNGASQNGKAPLISFDASKTWTGSTSLASESNSVYGNSDTVQPRATQMILYFYVGEFTETATEQSAGITTETLNGKADIDLDNISDSAKEVIAYNASPSNRHIELALETTQTLYTSPVNGWLVLCKETGSQNASFIELINETNKIQSNVFSTGNAGFRLRAFVPVSVGDQVKVNYNYSGTVDFFGFIYANGN